MVPDVHLSTHYGLGWFWIMKNIFQGSNSQFYSWWTIAHAVPSLSPCIEISLDVQWGSDVQWGFEYWKHLNSELLIVNFLRLIVHSTYWTLFRCFQYSNPHCTSDPHFTLFHGKLHWGMPSKEGFIWRDTSFSTKCLQLGHTWYIFLEWILG